jgi:uncharacterized protein (TIGR00266 family)
MEGTKMDYTIKGELAQIVKLQFRADETCWGSKGSLLSFDPYIDWSLKVPGGMGGAARRLMSGEGIALTFIEAKRDNQEVILAANEPGKMIDWDLKDGAVVTTRGSFVAAFGEHIDIDVMIAKRAGAAFFGGAGLFLQKVSGQGNVIIHGAGDFIDRYLEKDESILVSTGNLAAFSDEIDYDIQRVAGLRRMLFSGEGLFMTKLTGPGRVLLQSLKRESASKKQAST